MSPLCGKKGEAAKGVEGETKEGYIGRNKGTICGPIWGTIWGTIWHIVESTRIESFSPRIM